MQHPGFFERVGPFALREIAEKVGAALTRTEDGSRIIGNVQTLQGAGPDELAFFDNRKYVGQLADTLAGACILAGANVKRAPRSKRGKLTLESIHKLDRREARLMPKFVKLLIDDEATMLVNLETVTKIKDGDEEGLTAIYFIGSEHPLRVKDSGQDILRKAKAEW